MVFLTFWDAILTPFYLLILVFIARRYRDRKYPPGDPLRKYFMTGLYLKFGGVIFIALIYQFLYGGLGDTSNFLFHAKVINSALPESVGTWFDLVRRVPVEKNLDLYVYMHDLWWYHDVPSYTVAVFTAIFGLLNGTTYIPIGLLFAFFTYTGIWAMFRTFYGIYPHLHKPLAIAFLYIPSTFVWGSSIFKDTVCMFSLGWLIYTVFAFFLRKEFSRSNILLFLLSFYLIFLVKLYILMAFVPAVAFWALMTYSRKIQSGVTRLVVNLFSIGLVVASFMFIAEKYADELNQYSLENIVKKAKVTREYITYVSETQEGSAYDLGAMDGTLTGMLSNFPAAVNVTLFRPYVWEVTKPIMVLSALEALAFLYFTILLFWRYGLVRPFKIIFKSPNLIFMLVFTLIFAFSVGISTGNFGTLSRYKIPCMPFFAALLAIVHADAKRARETEYYLRRPDRKPEMAG